MPTRRHDMTETDRTSATNALHIAAERYEQNARDLRHDATDDTRHSYERLAVTFDRQAETARRLAETLENADTITIATLAE